LKAIRDIVILNFAIKAGEIIMRICTVENFKFTSKYLWGAFLVSFPYIPLAVAELINPHRDITGLMIPLSVIASLALIFVSIVKKERQILFVFIDSLIAIIIATFPLICH
jgi:hypothetical protein